MNFAIVITSNEPEKVWNAFRIASTSLAYENEVTVFLLGQGVEAPSVGNLKFDVKQQMDLFRKSGGTLIGCGVCTESRMDTMPLLQEELACDMGTISNLYELIAKADKVITF